MLIYGAFKPPVRFLVLMVAIASKLVFIGLVLVQGREFVRGRAGLAVMFDSLMIMLFIAYLVTGLHDPKSASPKPVQPRAARKSIAR
jgi:hypothetical protein